MPHIQVYVYAHDTPVIYIYIFKRQVGRQAGGYVGMHVYTANIAHICQDYAIG